MIPIKTKQDIECMREGGAILARVFEKIAGAIKAGVSAADLDRKVQEFIESSGATPSFLGYQGYRHATCISRNEEVVHGIPYAKKIFFPGDICSLDIGVFYKGFHSDAARTFAIERVDDDVQHLVQTTEEAFFYCIQYAKPGNRLGDISNALQRYVEDRRLSIVRDLYSHGVGKSLHEEPLIPNFGLAGKGPKLEVGMTFAIEPMVNLGAADVLTLDDKWTIITADKKWSAHYENTILISESGPEILTIR